MADFFKDMEKRVTEVVNELGKKTGDTIEIQKIKSDIRSLQRANNRDYMDIGRMVYEKFQDGEIRDTDYITLCESIEKREETIEQQKEEIQRIREGM